MKIQSFVPKHIRNFLRPVKIAFSPKKTVKSKHEMELDFWRNNFKADNHQFRNDWYKNTMLEMAMEKNDDFIKDKTIGDFGCGPRGTLKWAEKGKVKIGIDVLADVYIDEFKDCLLSHDMVYLKSTEHVIPLPTNYIDILFTLNAIDHVNNFGPVRRI